MKLIRDIWKRTERSKSIALFSEHRKLKQLLEAERQVFLLYIDVVRLQEMEMKHGEKMVTEALSLIWECIKENAEKFFLEDDLVGVHNIWGDDFVICFSPKVSSLPPAVMEKKLFVFQTRLEYECNLRLSDYLSDPVSFHMGYAALDRRDPNLHKQIYMAVKRAMKWAKQSNSTQTSTLAYEFQDILEKRLITAHFQPIVSLQTGEAFGWESLARGPKDSYFTSPHHLFSFAEEAGVLFHLEKLCREQALLRCSNLPPGTKIFLNMNPKSIDDPSFVKGYTAALLRQYHLSPRDVVVEITERHNISDYNQFKKSLENYRSQGYLIAIDDMGAGYSNLQSVVELAPDFIKLDISLISGIDTSRMRQAVIESFVTLSKKIDCKLIAEGIERAEELQTLLRLGIEYGQGYFLARPTERFSPVSPIALDEIRKNAQLLKEDLISSSKTVIKISDIIQPAVKVNSSTTVRDVHAFFQRDSKLASVVIEHDGKPTGLVMRQHLLQYLSSPYGVSLYYGRSITKIMDTEPLCLDRDESIDIASKMAMNRGDLKLYDDIIITDDGEVFGIVTIRDMIEKITQIQIEMAKYANPLTGLPGNIRIEEKLVEMLHENETFAVIYCDLDYFKQFNDKYGFEMGDRMILFTARLFQIMMKKFGSPEDFLGHIGGDDFIIITSSDRAERLGQSIVRYFKKVMAILNRNSGVFVSISLASILCHKDWFDNHLQIAESAATVKKMAKSQRGSVFLFVTDPRSLVTDVL